MMVAVVRRGTGRAAALDGVQVAGKTGTATIATGRSHAWFVAFAPADAPRIAVAIVVENAGYGGFVAAPIARRVIATALAHEPG
jgi:peptidoglycan glycosyltransferase